jgi:bifunctional ADP-heptose synthase (sugar kinase/adenylyltransferase)
MLVHTLRGDEFLTDRLPALNTSPKDVAGAGDSFFISSTMAMRVGADIWRSSYLGALAAALQVSRVGNSPMSVAELVSEIDGPSFEQD